jgi:predicted RNase H-like HicB family nuclease
MDMQFQVVLERDEATRHYTASVPGLPIVVDATNKRDAISMAREAIGLYLEETGRATQSVRAELDRFEAEF